MEKHFNGIHHISVLAGDAQRNARFYVNTLGMRMVKKSVNQDDPGTYHLFYGNAVGSPGSGLTFFPWPHARQGKPGSGQAVTVALAVGEGAFDFWAQYLAEEGIDFDGPYDRFGQQAIRFSDPDLLQLELVTDPASAGMPAWDAGKVPATYGIRGFKGATLLLQEAAPTAEVLTEVFKFRHTSSVGHEHHYTTDAPIGNSVIIREGGGGLQANGRGIIHHVAFRAADREDLEMKRAHVIRLGLQPTEVIDRHWFLAVYFRSPGGVLFEISTDGPGYAVDEDPDKLGQKLILPPWLEERRAAIEQMLPEINL